MKNLKFRNKFIKDILDGKKIDTWRLFDEKNLQIGDELKLLDYDTKEIFAKAIISKIQEKKIKDLTEKELKDHGYESKKYMQEEHKKYYGDNVTSDTLVKIINFKLT